MREKICRNHFLLRANDCDLGNVAVQSGLKIANDPNFVSTSIRCFAATARMKTNLSKDNISIQFEGEPCRRTRRVHQTVVENVAFFVVLDGLTRFMVRYFQHILCQVDDARAWLHENQVAVLSFLLLVLWLKQFSSSFAHRPLSADVAS